MLGLGSWAGTFGGSLQSEKSRQLGCTQSYAENVGATHSSCAALTSCNPITQRTPSTHPPTERESPYFCGIGKSLPFTRLCKRRGRSQNLPSQMTAISLVGPSIITTIRTYQLIESFDAVVGAVRKVFLDQVIEDELVIRAISLQAYSKVIPGESLLVRKIWISSRDQRLPTCSLALSEHSSSIIFF